MLRREAAKLSPLKLGDGLPARVRLRHRLPVQLREPRLVIETLQMRRPARHVEPDDALGPRRHMGSANDAVPLVGGWALLGDGAAGIKQRREGGESHAAGGVAKEGAALQSWNRVIHPVTTPCQT